MKSSRQFVTGADRVQLCVHRWGEAPSPQHPRETIVLLHGFPDCALFWEPVAQALAATHHVVAYDMRGCGASTPISGRRAYRYAPLIDDLFAVIDAVIDTRSPKQKVHLVGHDWGGLYGWDALLDARATDRIASFTTLAPSLNQVGLWMRRRLLRPTPANLGQVLHQMLVSNGLMTFFTLPVLPELMWRSGLGSAFMKTSLRRFEGLTRTPRPGLTDDAIRYLGIYRSNLLQQALRPRQPVRTAIPVHTVVATRDPFLPPRVFEGCAEWTTHHTQSTLDASHWAPLSRPTELAALIEAHVRAHAVGAIGDGALSSNASPHHPAEHAPTPPSPAATAAGI